MKHQISTGNFRLSLSAEVFKRDIACPSNTLLSVNVESDGFCAQATMDIDVKAFASFIRNLSALYTTLHGTAKIAEPFGHRCYLDFSAMTGGHIEVSGMLNSYGRNGFAQKLQFENSIDQTYLKDFIESLQADYEKYLH